MLQDACAAEILKAAVPVRLSALLEAVQWFLIVTIITGLLDGLTLEKAVTHKRLFFQDYHSVLADDIAPKVLLTGPCLSIVICLYIATLCSVPFCISCFTAPADRECACNIA